MKRCPFCAEEIQDEAMKCRFCGANVHLSPTALSSNVAWAPPAPTRTSGMAIASLVLGILWLGWVGSILALVFGYAAKKEISRDPTRITGRGMATAGIVLGWLGVAVPLVILLVVLLMIGFSSLSALR